jgi:hypothetical protein
MSSCKLDQVPEWARSWCYYFAAMAFVTMIAGIMTLFMSSKLGIATTILSLVAALIQAATGMTLFWMCRTSFNSAVSPDARVWNISPDHTSVKQQLLTMFG